MNAGPSDCADAAALYRHRFGWPCTAAGHALWTLGGEAFDAVDVPEYLGPGTVAALRDRQRPHPVIEVPGDPGYWRFLVAPKATRAHGMVRELASHGAIHLAHATVIELPPTRVRGGELGWLHGPSGAVPSLPHLVAAVVSVVLDEARRSRFEHPSKGPNQGGVAREPHGILDP